MKYLIANWKAQMNKNEIVTWTGNFSSLIQNDSLVSKNLRQKITDKEIKIIIFPSFPYIMLTRKLLPQQLDIYVGAQTVSTKSNGKFTGEVTAESLIEICSYAIIGHSERRLNFAETEEEISKKIIQCTTEKITPILCVRNSNDKIYSGLKIVAYEPVEAIGSGANASVENVLEMKKNLSLPKNSSFLYGGSADDSNIDDYLKTNEVDGFLVGTASLSPETFYKMALKMI